MEKDFVILELIPDKEENGNILQLEALKVRDLKIVDRFDYRIDDSFVNNEQLLKIISYDREKFNYVKDPVIMINDFKKFIEDDLLYIIDTNYTKHYLKDISNEKKSIFEIFGIELSNNSFTELVEKYQLEQSNYLVDLLYEAYVFESNKEK